MDRPTRYDPKPEPEKKAAEVAAPRPRDAGDDVQEWIRWGAVILSFVCLALFAAGAAYQAYAREQEMLSEKYRADNVTHEAISQGRRAAACEERERALGVAIAGHEPDPRGAYVGEAPLVCRVNGREWPAVREGGGRACRVHLP